MEHLIARIRSIKGTETSKLKKVLSDKTIYKLDDDLTSFVPYEPDHNLEPAFTTAERRLAGLFPVKPRRFPLQSVRIAAENLLV